jgi:hypothetical protein
MADDGTLHQRGEHRAGTKSHVPKPARALRLKAELESDPAQDEADQHQNDWHIECRQHDRIGERKSGEQTPSAQNQPGLVAVPERRDRCHHGIAVFAGRREREQHAKAKIVAAEQNVKKHREGEDRRPNQRQDHRQELGHLARRFGHGFPAAAMGR